MNEIISKIIDSIKQANPLMYVASGMEDIVKVLVEYKYDALEKTRYFQKLQNLEMKKKLIIVSVMFAINSRLKIKMAENTPGNLFLKGILTDFFPEIGKRLINGSKSPDPDEQKVIELIRESGTEEAYAPEEKSGIFKSAHNDLNQFLKERLERKRRERNGRQHP